MQIMVWYEFQSGIGIVMVVHWNTKAGAELCQAQHHSVKLSKTFSGDCHGGWRNSGKKA